MKKIFVAIVVILWIIAGFQYFNMRNQKNEEKIMEAFSKTEFSENESHVEAYGEYGGNYLSLSQRKELLKELGKKLGITDEYEITEKQEENYQEVALHKKARKADTILRFSTMEYREDSEEPVITSKQYVFIDITLYESLNSALAYKEVLNELLKEYQIYPQITVDLKGSYEGKLSLDEKDMVANRLLEILDAEIVSEYRTEELYTIYGYTSYVEEAIVNKNQKINVNVAINYDEAEEKTHLYLSSPVITGDY